MLLVALLLPCLFLTPPLTSAQTPPSGTEWVEFDSFPSDTSRPVEKLRGLITRPPGDGRYPGVVLMHGCGGLTTSSGALVSRFRMWMEVLRDGGFVVLLVDSFNPRGFSQVCTLSPRPVLPTTRPADARGGLAFLQQLEFVDPSRVALIGWSHGGGATLATVVGPVSTVGGELAAFIPPARPWFRAAVAFYPGCLTASRPTQIGATTPLLILQGEADDWTPPEPCHRLLERAASSPHPIELKLYPGAYHSFDDPNTPVRLRTDVPRNAGRGVHVGTDPAARDDALATVPAFLARYLGE